MRGNWLLRGWLAVVVGSLVLACGARPIDPRTYAIGRYDASDRAALFARVSVALDELGYPPEVSDGARGMLAVSSHRRVHRDHATFHLQLHTDGWIVITPAGPDIVQADWDAWSMPPALVEEYASLAVNLRERLDAERP